MNPKDESVRLRAALRRLRRENAQIERRARQQAIELEATQKELAVFAYSISHDLRAPLRHIDGFSKLLTETTGDTISEEGKHFLQAIASSVAEMSGLIDALLDLSRTGRMEIHRDQVDLSGLIEKIIRDLAPEIKGREITWKIKDLPSVEADSALLRKVLTLLLSNAVKFTRPLATAEIEIGARIERDEIVIFVRDNGVGFDMEYAGKLFGVFQRLHRKEEFEGIGMGLANVRRIIARHGGRTWAESKSGEGAVFYFTLPRLRV